MTESTMTTDNMSNEEVIEVLKGMVFGSFDRTTQKERQALDFAIKALKEKQQGEWVRKKNIIRYIATQYSEHNELVPVWLNIGDLKGGAE